MKIRYLLKRRGPKGGNHPVYLAIYKNDLTEIIFTGQRITVKEWSQKERAPKDHTGEAFKAIEVIKADVQKAIKRLEADEKPVTPFTVKREYLERQEMKESTLKESDRKAKKELVTISKLAGQWLEAELFRFRTSTQKAVRESINAFTEFLKAAGLATLERKGLTQDVVREYEKYLLVKKKLSDNTHGKRMKHLRWFLKSLNYDVSSIKLRSAKKTIISLSMTELGKLETVDVSFNNEWQRAKDLFLLGCYTGLRVSDLKRLSKTNTQENEISLKLLKNSKEVRIPIIPEAKTILDKYDSRAPKLSEQGLNQSIKLVCEKAGITERITIDTTRGGQRMSTTVPKHQVITSHVSGKTFITLAPQRWGLSPAEIAAIVGKDTKTLLGSYFNTQADEARKKILTVENSRQMKVS